MNIIKADSRGATNIGWLDSRHSFSFGDYYDTSRMEFGKLRVLNDDIIAPRKGFGMHPHANMEIITVMLEGILTHTDSMEHEEELKSGEMQVMSAGSGIMHSEYNHSDKPVHLLQIWIYTKEENITPRYDQRKFSAKSNSIEEVVSGHKSKNALYIHQDASLKIARFDKEEEFFYGVDAGRGAYVFLIKGNVSIDDHELHERDAAELTQSFKVYMKKNSEMVIIEVPI